MFEDRGGDAGQTTIQDLLERRLTRSLTRAQLTDVRFIENYVLDAERLVRELQSALRSLMALDGSLTTADAFQQVWSSELSDDEQEADRLFFDDSEFDEPSRAWILAEQPA